ncbi:phosphotransferase family protein [Yinghuangia seranimata]|uniref:phosphotransferase family protein n=1 Tax=Yinghuangia seranimata TaxID=408067 RepID=UPI00248D2624|nr:phosphotransferase family protein [Yinghuangia seranimata]MDI2127574.1 phosphotransferase family protein [Yinghuangia seranimata]
MESLIRTWLEQNLGPVERLERQARWRPVWFADVVRDGRTLELCVRGDRTDYPGVFPLEHEMLVQSLMHERGVPVAGVHGWIDEPRAFVIDRVPGQPDFAGCTEAQRDAVMDDYLRILAELHALDVAPFEAAGVRRGGVAAYERWYRASKKRPDPFMEFCLGWLRRHPLDARGRESVVVWDSGQFHHDGQRVTAVLDLELAHIGDPLMDLAAFRMRDTIIGYGDFRRMYAKYEELSGRPVDAEAVAHHHFAFTLTNQLAFHAALADPPPGSDYMTNLQWCNETNLFAVEALADFLGVPLEAPELPAAAEPSAAAVPTRHLVESLRSGDYELRRLFRLARHLQRFDEIGRACVEADLDDLAVLLGRRPRTWQEGDAALEEFVVADDGAHDKDLVPLFHRRLWRAHQLMGPAGSAMTTHHRLQDVG